MNQNDFQKIIKSLNEHLSNCKSYLDDIHSTEDLNNKTVSELIALRDFCRREEAEMTRICMVDLYHILGMGKLTLTQQNIFLKMFKEYCSYRSDIKVLAGHLKEIDNLPKLPTKSKFKLLELGDVVLESTLRVGCESEESYESVENIKDYQAANKQLKDDQVEELSKSNDIENTIVIKGNEMSLTLDQIDLFLKLLNITNVSYKEQILKKAQRGANYMGIMWHVKNSKIHGVLTKEMKDRLKKFKTFVVCE